MTQWFTSDLHLGHENVAVKHRGARSVEQHDQTIITNLMRHLQSGDSLYILGDLSLGRKRDIDHAVTLLAPVCKRIGYRNMHLIRGNHDPKTQPSISARKTTKKVTGRFGLSAEPNT